MSHVLVILPDPDWIQLSNVARKLAKHGDLQHVYTTRTVARAGTLAQLPQASKVHVIGHGGSHSLEGISVEELADALKQGGLPNGCKVRVDTCSSAAILQGGVPNVAQLLLMMLGKKGIRNTSVEGTVGPSITGMDHGRQVVADMNTVRWVQGVLTALNLADIDAAGQLIDGQWREDLSPQQIKTLARQVRQLTDKFFADFEVALENIGSVWAVAPLYDKNSQPYKAVYA